MYRKQYQMYLAGWRKVSASSSHYWQIDSTFRAQDAETDQLNSYLRMSKLPQPYQNRATWSQICRICICDLLVLNRYTIRGRFSSNVFVAKGQPEIHFSLFRLRGICQSSSRSGYKCTVTIILIRSPARRAVFRYPFIVVDFEPIAQLIRDFRANGYATIVKRLAVM